MSCQASRSTRRKLGHEAANTMPRSIRHAVPRLEEPYNLFPFHNICCPYLSLELGFHDICFTLPCSRFIPDASGQRIRSMRWPASASCHSAMTWINRRNAGRAELAFASSRQRIVQNNEDEDDDDGMLATVGRVRSRCSIRQFRSQAS